MSVKTVIRRLLRIPNPAVGREQALEIARAEALKRGLASEDPRVDEGLREWTVWLRPGVKSSPFVVIDQQSGRVIRVAALPR